MKLSPRTILLLLLPALLFGADALKYQKPPKPVMDVLSAPATPALALNPNHTYAVESQPVRYPSIAELSQPMLRLAGMRINPKTNGLHNTVFNTSLTLRKIPEGTEIKVDLPPNPKLSGARWSPDGIPLRLHQHHRDRHRAVDRRHHRQDPQGRRRACQWRDGRRHLAAVAADAAAPAAAFSERSVDARRQDRCWWKSPSPIAARPRRAAWSPKGRTCRRAWAAPPARPPTKTCCRTRMTRICSNTTPPRSLPSSIPPPAK